MNLPSLRPNSSSVSRRLKVPPRIRRSVWPQTSGPREGTWFWTRRAVRSVWAQNPPFCQPSPGPIITRRSATTPSAPANWTQTLATTQSPAASITTTIPPQLMMNRGTFIRKKPSGTTTGWWWAAFGWSSPKLWPSTPSWPSEPWSSDPGPSGPPSEPLGNRTQPDKRNASKFILLIRSN